MKPKYGIAFLVLIWLILPITARNVFAVTVEVAKKCQSLSAKAFPPRVPGNPAAGLMHGTGRDASEYFRRCVENGGNVEENREEQTPQDTK
ncbi:MAG TPA: hypothetical protein VJS37_11905 [Terriglobales bacterium]|nr:hypothetical protein [Terriglobales bacterium]